ncbi:MAG: universal stress protein [Kiritimatiellia bacterium]
MKLLAALDLASSTPAVLREARNWARRLSAELVLIHVAEPDPDFVGYGAGPESVRLAVAHKFTRAHRQIEALAVELRLDGIDAKALLIQGSTAETILREADNLSADAILMGTRARGAIHDLMVGSVSKEVLRHSSRPVLLIPPRVVS